MHSAGIGTVEHEHTAADRRGRLASTQDQLVVNWDDGHRSRYRWIWLRDSCLCPTCVAEGTSQRMRDVRALPVDVRPAAADIIDDALWVRWETDGHDSRYLLGWLRAMCGCSRHVTPWPVATPTAATAPVVGTWTWDQVCDSDEALADWLEEVVRSGRALLTGVPTRPGAVLDVVERFGYTRETNYGRVFDVRVEPDPANLAFSAHALGPHTDNPYRDPAPTLQLLHCLVSSMTGGETILVDGFAAAGILQSEHAPSYDHLAMWPVRWRYGDATTELAVERPVLELSSQGELMGIRFNERARCPSPLHPDIAHEHLAALRRFASILDDGDQQARLTLEPGDLVLFDNRRTLHGRTAFSSRGHRHLQGCYAERDGLASRLAVLRRRPTAGSLDGEALAPRSTVQA